MKRNIGILSAMLVGASVYAAEAPTVSGFVHAQANYVDTDRNGDKGDVNFLVNDGAVYFQRAVGNAKVMMDLPFSTSSSTGKIELDAGAKGQAYIWHSFGALSWKLGQWDTPFGYEANDSADRTFNTDGAVASADPVVHRGLSFGYDVSEMLGVQWFVANPTAAFTNAPSSTNNDKVESGLNVAAKMDNLSLNIGALYGRAVKKNHYGIFFNTGYQMDALRLGLELNYLKDKDSIANSSPEKLMAALHLGYAMSDMMNLGFRTEYLKHKDADIFTATVGPQYEVEKDVVLKADYSLRRDNQVFATGAKSSGPKYFTHTLAFGAVARF